MIYFYFVYLTESITNAVPFQVKVFIQPHYLHNFVQSTFNALTPEKVRGKGSFGYRMDYVYD